ncbi:hypothetical protein OSTOST_05720 [Ostertagia ostertagi]
MSQGVSTRTAKQLEDLVSSRINEECDLIELELQRLKGLEQEAYACKEVVCETLALVLKARALQSDTVKQRAEQHGNVLSYKVENKAALGQAASQSKHSDGFRFQNAEAGGSGNATEIAYEQLNVSDFDHVEYHLNFDPVAAAQGKLYENGKASKVKHEISEPRLLQPEKMTDYRPRTRGSSQSSSMTFQSPGGSSCSESQIGHIFASIALPEVEVYKDPEGRSFEDFIMRFSMKYQNLRLQDELLNHLLLSKLDGYPKAVAKALPKHIREGNFDDLVDALRSKFEVNSSSIQMKAYMDLKRLRRSGDVTRYCLDSHQGRRVVTIAKRMYLRPGETKSLRVHCDGTAQEGIFWSKEHLLPDVVWKGGNQATELPITNTFAGAKIFRVGEEVGTFEPTEVVEVQPVKYSGDMLQRTVEVTGDREEKLLRLLQSNRTSEECNESLEKLVRHYAHAFAVSEQELTQTTLVEHSIETGDAMPIRQKARPVPLGTRVELRRILNDLQERKIIEPSKSSWASPIVLVQKKDGTLRLCVDYRKLNQELIVALVAEEPEWTNELREDPIYAEVIVNLEKGNLDMDVAIPELSHKFKVADFIMDKRYLALLDNCSVRRVVPPSKRRAIFEEAHSGSLAGHFGPKKLFRQLSKDLFWETMKRDIAQWSQDCRECLCHNHRHPMTPGLKPIVTTKPCHAAMSHV